MQIDAYKKEREDCKMAVNMIKKALEKQREI